MESNTNQDSPTSPSHDRYLSNEELEGRPTLTNINEDDVTVDASEINDNSTGMGEDDYLGKSNKEEDE